MSAITAPIKMQYVGIFNPNFVKNLINAPFGPDCLDIVIAAFAKVVQIADNTFSIMIDSPPGVDGEGNARQLLSQVKQINPQAKLHLSLVQKDDGPSPIDVAGDPSFPARAIAYMQCFGFNGLNIDQETGIDKNGNYIGKKSGSKTDHPEKLGSRITDLISNLGPSFNEVGFDITMCVMDYPDQSFDVPTFNRYVKYLLAESYGTNFDGKGVAQAFINAGFLPKMIVLGVISEPYAGGGTDTTGPDGSVKDKCGWVVEMGLGGAFVWRTDNEIKAGFPVANEMTYWLDNYIVRNQSSLLTSITE